MMIFSAVLAISIIVDNPPATASFVTPAAQNSSTTSPQNDETGYTPGTQSLATADLATPSSLTAASTCQGAGSANIAVGLSWSDTQSSSLDADQNPLLSGYSIWRSTSSSGPFSQVGSVTSTGTTPAATAFTDINPSGATTPNAYVANINAGTVSVIDTATNAVTATITLPAPKATFTYAPDALAITPNGSDAYVAVYVTKTSTGAAKPGIVDVIDTATNAVTATITLTGTNAPEPDAVAITPNGSYAYVADYDNGIVDVIDTTTNAVTATITLTGTNAPEPYAVAITPNGSYAYVADADNNVLDVIDTTTNAVTATITLPAPKATFTYEPTDLAISPNSSYAYVTVYVTKTSTGAAKPGIVDVIDTATNAVTATITLTGTNAPEPDAVAITPNGCSAYVTDYYNDIEDVIDTASNTVTTTITLTSAPDLGPHGVAITPNDQAAYVATYCDYSTKPCTYTTIVDPLDLANNKLGAPITVGSGPYAVAIQPSTYYYEVQAYHVSNWTSSYSAVIPITLGFVY
ncbi:MAG: hypothetical protein ACYDGY_02825 [Acidimicrobiales bacterium]